MAAARIDHGATSDGRQPRAQAIHRAPGPRDFAETYVQSGERLNGLASVQGMAENYPGGYEGLGHTRVVGAEDRWVTTPSFTLLRLDGTGNVFTGVQKVRYPGDSVWYVIAIAEIKDGLVWKVQTFFAPTFEPPAWRAEWVEIVAE
jgi:hypothetical protein